MTLYLCFIITLYAFNPTSCWSLIIFLITPILFGINQIHEWFTINFIICIEKSVTIFIMRVEIKAMHLCHVCRFIRVFEEIIFVPFADSLFGSNVSQFNCISFTNLWFCVNTLENACVTIWPNNVGSTFQLTYTILMMLSLLELIKLSSKCWVLSLC